MAEVIIPMKAKLEGYQESLNELKKGIESLNIGSKASAAIIKQFDQAQKMLDKLSKNPNMHASSYGGINQIFGNVDEVGAQILDIIQQMNSLSGTDFNFSSDMFAAGLKEVNEALAAAEEKLQAGLANGFKEAVSDTTDLGQSLKQLGIDAEKIGQNETISALQKIIRDTGREAEAAESKIAKLNAAISGQETKKANIQERITGLEQLRTELTNLQPDKGLKMQDFETEVWKLLNKGHITKGTATIQDRVANLMNSVSGVSTPEELMRQMNTFFDSFSPTSAIRGIWEKASQGPQATWTPEKMNEMFGGPTDAQFEAYKNYLIERMTQYGLGPGNIRNATDVAGVRNSIQNSVDREVSKSNAEVMRIDGKIQEHEAQRSRIQAEADAVKNKGTVASETLESLNLRIQEFDTKLHTLAQEVQQLKDERNAKANEIFRSHVNTGGAQTQVQDSMAQSANAVRQYQQELDKASAKQEALGKFKGLVQRWFSVYAAVRMVRQAIQSVVKNVTELDKTITKISIVTSMSSGDLWGQMGQYADMAQKYGASISGVYEVSQLYYQQGLQTNDVMTLTESTLKLAQISGMDYANATNLMTNAIRSFKMEQQEANTVTDVYAALAASSASSVEELATAMSKTASSAQSVGASFQETSAMIAVMIEATREAPENIGSALKSIISRYGELKESPNEILNIDGEEISLNKVDKALQTVGISIHDAQGQFRNFGEVIRELSSIWNTLDSNTQRYIATIMAGNRQQSRFLALVSSGERYEELLNTAENSEDAGTLQQLKTMDSVAAKAQQAKTAFESIYTSAGIQNFLKGWYDVQKAIGNTLAKISSGPTGLIGVISKVSTLFVTLAKVVSLTFKSLARSFASEMAYAQAQMTAEQRIAAIKRMEISNTEKQKKIADVQQELQNFIVSEEMKSGTQMGQSNIRRTISLKERGTNLVNRVGGVKMAGAMVASMLGMALTTAAASMDEQGNHGQDRIAKGWLTIGGGLIQNIAMGQMMIPGVPGLILGALSAIPSIIEGVGILVETSAERLERLKKEAEEAQQKSKESKAKANTFENEIKELEKLKEHRYDSAEAMQEYLDKMNEIADNNESLISAYDAEGNAIILLSTAYKELNSLRAQSAADAKTAADASYAHASELHNQAKTTFDTKARDWARELTYSSYMNFSIPTSNGEYLEYDSKSGRRLAQLLMMMGQDTGITEFDNYTDSDLKNRWSEWIERISGTRDDLDLLWKWYTSVKGENNSSFWQDFADRFSYGWGNQTDYSWGEGKTDTQVGIFFKRMFKDDLSELSYFQESQPEVPHLPKEDAQVYSQDWIADFVDSWEFKTLFNYNSETSEDDAIEATRELLDQINNIGPEALEELVATPNKSLLTREEQFIIKLWEEMGNVYGDIVSAESDFQQSAISTMSSIISSDLQVWQSIQQYGGRITKDQKWLLDETNSYKTLPAFLSEFFTKQYEYEKDTGATKLAQSQWWDYSQASLIQELQKNTEGFSDAEWQFFNNYKNYSLKQVQQFYDKLKELQLVGQTDVSNWDRWFESIYEFEGTDIIGYSNFEEESYTSKLTATLQKIGMRGIQLPKIITKLPQQALYKYQNLITKFVEGYSKGNLFTEQGSHSLITSLNRFLLQEATQLDLTNTELEQLYGILLSDKWLSDPDTQMEALTTFEQAHGGINWDNLNGYQALKTAYSNIPRNISSLSSTIQNNLVKLVDTYDDWFNKISKGLDFKDAAKFLEDTDLTWDALELDADTGKWFVKNIETVLQQFYTQYEQQKQYLDTVIGNIIGEKNPNQEFEKSALVSLGQDNQNWKQLFENGVFKKDVFSSEGAFNESYRATFSTISESIGIKTDELIAYAKRYKEYRQSSAQNTKAFNQWLYDTLLEDYNNIDNEAYSAALGLISSAFKGTERLRGLIEVRGRQTNKVVDTDTLDQRIETIKKLNLDQLIQLARGQAITVDNQQITLETLGLTSQDIYQYVKDVQSPFKTLGDTITNVVKNDAGQFITYSKDLASILSVMGIDVSKYSDGEEVYIDSQSIQMLKDTLDEMGDKNTQLAYLRSQFVGQTEAWYEDFYNYIMNDNRSRVAALETALKKPKDMNATEAWSAVSAFNPDIKSLQEAVDTRWLVRDELTGNFSLGENYKTQIEHELEIYKTKNIKEYNKLWALYQKYLNEDNMTNAISTLLKNHTELTEEQIKTISDGLGIDAETFIAQTGAQLKADGTYKIDYSGMMNALLLYGKNVHESVTAIMQQMVTDSTKTINSAIGGMDLSEVLALIEEIPELKITDFEMKDGKWITKNIDAITKFYGIQSDELKAIAFQDLIEQSSAPGANFTALEEQYQRTIAVIDQNTEYIITSALIQAGQISEAMTRINSKGTQHTIDDVIHGSVEGWNTYQLQYVEELQKYFKDVNKNVFDTVIGNLKDGIQNTTIQVTEANKDLLEALLTDGNTLNVGDYVQITANNWDETRQAVLAAMDADQITPEVAASLVSSIDSAAQENSWANVAESIYQSYDNISTEAMLRFYKLTAKSDQTWKDWLAGDIGRNFTWNEFKNAYEWDNIAAARADLVARRSEMDVETYNSLMQSLYEQEQQKTNVSAQVQDIVKNRDAVSYDVLSNLAITLGADVNELITQLNLKQNADGSYRMSYTQIYAALVQAKQVTIEVVNDIINGIISEATSTLQSISGEMDYNEVAEMIEKYGFKWEDFAVQANGQFKLIDPNIALQYYSEQYAEAQQILQDSWRQQPVLLSSAQIEKRDKELSQVEEDWQRQEIIEHYLDLGKENSLREQSQKLLESSARSYAEAMSAQYEGMRKVIERRNEETRFRLKNQQGYEGAFIDLDQTSYWDIYQQLTQNQQALAEYGWEQSDVNAFMSQWKTSRDTLANAYANSLLGQESYITVTDDLLGIFSELGQRNGGSFASVLNYKKGQIISWSEIQAAAEAAQLDLESFITSMFADDLNGLVEIQKQLHANQHRGNIQTTYKAILGNINEITEDSLMDMAKDLGLTVAELANRMKLRLNEVTGNYIATPEALDYMEAQIRSSAMSYEDQNALLAQIEANRPEVKKVNTFNDLIKNHNALTAEMVGALANEMDMSLTDVKLLFLQENEDGTYRTKNLRQMKALISEYYGDILPRALQDSLDAIFDETTQSITQFTSLRTTGVNSTAEMRKYVNALNDSGLFTDEFTMVEGANAIFEWNNTLHSYVLNTTGLIAQLGAMSQTMQLMDSDTRTAAAQLVQDNAAQLAGAIDVLGYINSDRSQVNYEKLIKEPLQKYNEYVLAARNMLANQQDQSLFTEQLKQLVWIQGEIAQDTLDAGGEQAIRVLESLGKITGTEYSAADYAAVYRAHVNTLVNTVQGELNATVGSVVSNETAALLNKVQGYQVQSVNGMNIVREVGKVGDAVIAYYEAISDAAGATVAEINTAAAQMLEYKYGGTSQNVIDTLSSAGSMTFDAFGTFLQEFNIRLTDTLWEQLVSLNVTKALGGNQMAITNWTAMAEVLGIDTSSPKYISAFNTFNDSLIQMNREAETNILSQVKELSGARGGDSFNLTYLWELIQDFAKPENALIVKDLQDLGAYFQDGILTFSETAKIPEAISLITDYASQYGGLLANEIAELSEVVLEVLQTYTDAISAGLEGTLTQPAATQLIEFATTYGIDLSFGQTTEGLSLSTQQAILLYNEIVKLNSVAAAPLFEDIYTSFSAQHSELTSIGGLMAQIKTTQDAITAATQEGANAESARAAVLRTELELYKQMARERLTDSSAFKWQKDLPGGVQAALNFMDSWAEIRNTLKDSMKASGPQHGLMNVGDYYNMLQWFQGFADETGQTLTVGGMEFKANADSFQQYWESGLNALVQVSGDTTKIDLSNLGTKISFGANGELDLSSVDDQVKQFAQDQVKILDEVISIVEIAAKMEALGDLDVNGDMTLTLGEIFIDKNGAKELKQEAKDAISSLLDIANTESEYGNQMKATLESIKLVINDQEVNLYQLLDDLNTKSYEELTKFYGDDYGTFVSQILTGLYQFSQNDFDSNDLNSIKKLAPYIINIPGLDMIIKRDDGTVTYIDANGKTHSLTPEQAGQFTNTAELRKAIADSNKVIAEIQTGELWGENPTITESELIAYGKLNNIVKLEQGKYKVEYTDSSGNHQEREWDAARSMPNDYKTFLYAKIATDWSSTGEEKYEINDGMTTVHLKDKTTYTVSINDEGKINYAWDLGNGTTGDASSPQEMYSKMFNAMYDDLTFKGGTWDTNREFLFKIGYVPQITLTKENFQAQSKEFKDQIRELANAGDLDTIQNIFSEAGINFSGGLTKLQGIIELSENEALAEASIRQGEAADTQSNAAQLQQTAATSMNSAVGAFASAVASFAQAAGNPEAALEARKIGLDAIFEAETEGWESGQIEQFKTAVDKTNYKDNYGWYYAQLKKSAPGANSAKLIDMAESPNKYGNIPTNFSAQDQSYLSQFFASGESWDDWFKNSLGAAFARNSTSLKNLTSNEVEAWRLSNWLETQWQEMMGTITNQKPPANEEGGKTSPPPGSETPGTSPDLTGLQESLSTLGTSAGTAAAQASEAAGKISSAFSNITGSLTVTANVKINPLGGTLTSVKGNTGTFGASFAKGTLMGELGPELVVSGGRYFIAGQNGAEFVDLDPDAIVFNHQQTKRLMSSGAGGRGTPLVDEKHALSYAKGNANGGPALASASAALAELRKIRSMWAKLADMGISDFAKKGGGGGGGGGGEVGNFLGELERWYNLLQRIAKLEKDINYEEKLRSKIESDRAANGRAYYESYKRQADAIKQSTIYEQELLSLQEDRLHQRAADLEDSFFGKFYRWNEEEQIIEFVESGTDEHGNPIGFQMLADELYKTDKYGKPKYNAEEQYKLLTEQWGLDPKWIEYDESGKLIDFKKEGGYEAAMKNFDELLNSRKDEIDELNTTVREGREKVLDYAEQRNKLLQDMVDNQLEVEQTILKAVENRRQTEIDNAQDERDAIEESAQKFLDGLSEQLDKEKQLYDNNESNSEVDRLRRQLAILQRSGGSASEIRSLQDEIRQKDQDIYFEAQQQQIDAIQKASDQQLERLDHQIELMTEALEYDKEHGRLWQDVYEVMSKTPQEMMDFIMTYTSEYSSDSELQNRENIRKTMLQLETWYEYAQDQDKGALDYDANKETGYHWDNYWKSIVDRYPEAADNEELKAKVREAYVKGYATSDDPNKAYDAAKKVADETLKKEMPENEEDFSEDTGNTGGNGTATVRHIARYGEKTKILKSQSAKVGSTVEPIKPESTLTDGAAKYSYLGNNSGPIKIYSGGIYAIYYKYTLTSGKKEEVTNTKGYLVSGTDAKKASHSLRLDGVTTAEAARSAFLKKYPGGQVLKVNPYKTGGLADYTGLAMVHGTPSKPEAFLNAAETKMWKDEILSSGGRNSLANLLIDFRNSIGGMADSATYSTIGANGNIGDITLNMNVASIANDYDVRQAADTAMDEIVKIARRTTSVQVRR